MWEYSSICLYEFCFLLISMCSVLRSERRWTNLFICKMIFDVTSVSLLLLSFHPTSSYSSLNWARNVGLDFSGLSASAMWGDRDTAGEPPLGLPGGQEPALAEGQGSKLPSWRGLEKKGLWAAMPAGLWKLKFRISFWLGVKGGKIQ